MKFIRGQVCAAACLLVIASLPALGADQVASAQGRCGVAVNAADHAQVTINNYCDVETTAIVRLLIEKSKKNDRRLIKLEADTETKEKQIQELILAVQKVNKIIADSGADPVNARAGELLAKGDVSGAAQLLEREALVAVNAGAVANSKAAELYRQQAALLRTQDVNQALQALRKSLAMEPDHFRALWDAGELAVMPFR